jgi:predicted Zn-dependent protease with MMP-like domain
VVPLVDLTAERFDELVAEALDGLPEWVRERLENLDVIVVDRPPPGQPTLLGLYQGIPLTRRGSNYFGVLPDRITLFRATIAHGVRTETQLRERIRHTVVHEIAHFFGISDERLIELDRY